MPAQAALVCGNGVVELRQDCDEGNSDPGDCCSPTWQYESHATVLRDSTGDCDPTEWCKARYLPCPPDIIFPPGTVCRARSSSLRHSPGQLSHPPCHRAAPKGVAGRRAVAAWLGPAGWKQEYGREATAVARVRVITPNVVDRGSPDRGGGSGVNARPGSQVIGVHTSVALLGMHCLMVIRSTLQHFDMLHGV